MLKANGIPEVRFPKSVIDFRKSPECTGDGERESRKRQRDFNGSQLPVTLSESKDERKKRGVMCLNLMGNFTINLKHQHQHLHLHQLRHPQPYTHLEQHLNRTPTPTPSSSPQRASGAIVKKLREEDKDIGLVLIVKSYEQSANPQRIEQGQDYEICVYKCNI